MNVLTVYLAKNTTAHESSPNKNSSKLSVSLAVTPEKDSEHPPALTPGGSYSPLVKEFLESVKGPTKRILSRHRRNHSGDQFRWHDTPSKKMFRGRSLDQVDTDQLLVNIDQLTLPEIDYANESPSELGSLNKPQLVNLVAVSDGDMDSDHTPTVPLIRDDPTQGDSSSVDLLDTVSSQGEEGDDEEDYQPSSDLVPESPTGNEDTSSLPSSPDFLNVPKVTIGHQRSDKLVFLKTFFDSPQSKALSEFNDSGFHVSRYINSLHIVNIIVVFTDTSNKHIPNRKLSYNCIIIYYF